MKIFITLMTAMVFLLACSKPKESGLSNEINGSWELISAVQIRHDSVINTMTPGTKMIKIINGDHFAFLHHDLNSKSDSTAKPYFVAGGGAYALTGDQYTEHLEYCSAREYEGNDFSFTLTIHGDTLIQSGEEKLKDLGIGEENRKNVETYLRIKK
jgi:hypothetical protein